MNSIIVKDLEGKQISVFVNDFEVLDAYTQFEVSSLSEVKKIIDFCNDNTIVRPKGKNYIVLIPNNKQTFGYETFEKNVSNEGKFIETIKSELDITAQRHIYKILFFFRCKDTNKIAKCKIYKYDENNISCYLKIIQDSVSDEEKILCANDTQELTNKIIKAIRQYNKLEYIENVFMIDNNFI